MPPTASSTRRSSPNSSSSLLAASPLAHQWCRPRTRQVHPRESRSVEAGPRSLGACPERAPAATQAPGASAQAATALVTRAGPSAASRCLSLADMGSSPEKLPRSAGTREATGTMDQGTREMTSPGLMWRPATRRTLGPVLQLPGAYHAPQGPGALGPRVSSSCLMAAAGRGPRMLSCCQGDFVVGIWAQALHSFGAGATEPSARSRASSGRVVLSRPLHGLIRSSRPRRGPWRPGGRRGPAPAPAPAAPMATWRASSIPLPLHCRLRVLVPISRSPTLLSLHLLLVLLLLVRPLCSSRIARAPPRLLLRRGPPQPRAPRAAESLPRPRPRRTEGASSRRSPGDLRGQSRPLGAAQARGGARGKGPRSEGPPQVARRGQAGQEDCAEAQRHWPKTRRRVASSRGLQWHVMRQVMRLPRECACMARGGRRR